ncbi:MAG TPA: hypothetical protein VFB16_03685 [Bauldia sp.]|nr:hypothetical protein [Bauldia sp.]
MTPILPSGPAIARDPILRPLNLTLGTLGCIWFLFARLDYFWSGSSDLAFTTLLVSRRMEAFDLVSASGPSLGTLYSMPQLAFIPAAIAGALFGSPVVGVQIVSLLALLAVWLAGALAARTVPAGIAPSFLVTAFVLAILNDASLRVELFGGEIVGNFFYAQLVGQALTMVVIAATVFLEGRGGHPHTRYIVVALAIAVLVNIHLIPAAELLVFLLLTVFLDLRRSPPGMRLWRLGEGGLAVFGALLLIVLHPGFADAASATFSDGTMRLRYTPEAFHVLILALLVGALSIAALVAWLAWLDDDGRRQWAYLKALATFGLAVSACCTIQYVALAFGYGSAQAVKRYAFALNTTLFMALALAIAVRVTVELRRRRVGAAFFSERSARTLACLAPLTLVFSGNYQPPGQVSVSRLAEVDEFARDYRNLVLGAEPGKEDIAIGVRGIGAVGDLLVSVDGLAAPATGNVGAAFRRQPFPEPGSIRYLLTAPGAAPFDVPACRKYAAAIGLVVVDAQCAFAKNGPVS